MKYVFATATLIAAGSVVLWAQDSAPDPFKNAKAIPTTNVRIEIRDKLEVSVNVIGKLTQVAELGQAIRKGEVVVKLDDNRVQREYDRAKAAADEDVLIRFAEIKRDTAELDWKDKVTANQDSGRDLFTESEIRRAKLDYDQGVAEVQKAQHDQNLAKLDAAVKEAELEHYRVASAIDGIVTEVMHPVGEVVNQGEPILAIKNTEILRAILDVDQKYAFRFKVGDKVYLRTTQGISSGLGVGGGSRKSILGDGLRSSSGNSDQSTGSATRRNPSSGVIFEGEVILIAPELNGSDRRLVVTVDIKNKTDSSGRDLLKDGQSAEAVIIGE